MVCYVTETGVNLKLTPQNILGSDEMIWQRGCCWVGVQLVFVVLLKQLPNKNKQNKANESSNPQIQSNDIKLDKTGYRAVPVNNVIK